MCSPIKSIITIFYLFCVSNAKNSTKDAIGFPEMEENIAIQNKENRQPVYIPAVCPVNQLYYPGDQKDDWICDCRPGHLYDPDSDMCWPAYRQGPCQGGYYLTIRQDSAIPVCQKNPCDIDSYVMWNGKCQKMNVVGPCPGSLKRYETMVLGINATTLEVDCVSLNVQSRFPDTTTEVNNATGCAIGSKRKMGNKCVPV